MALGWEWEWIVGLFGLLLVAVLLRTLVVIDVDAVLVLLGWARFTLDCTSEVGRCLTGAWNVDEATFKAFSGNH